MEIAERSVTNLLDRYEELLATSERRFGHSQLVADLCHRYPALRLPQGKGDLPTPNTAFASWRPLLRVQSARKTLVGRGPVWDVETRSTLKYYEAGASSGRLLSQFSTSVSFIAALGRSFST
jgi:hypothetical protein